MKYLLLILSLNVFAQYKMEITSDACNGKCVGKFESREDLEAWYLKNAKKGDFGKTRVVEFTKDETPNEGHLGCEEIVTDEEHDLIDRARDFFLGERAQKCIYPDEFTPGEIQDISAEIAAKEAAELERKTKRNTLEEKLKAGNTLTTKEITEYLRTREGL